MSRRSRIVYSGLAILPVTAQFGLHKLYLGQRGLALRFTAITVGTLGLGGLPLWSCAVVGAARALAMSEGEFHERYVHRQTFV